MEFDTSWGYTDLYAHLKSLFKDLNVDFEILLPMGGKLTQIVLQEGAELNGSTLRRLFAQKIIYIRPLESISHDSNEFIADDLDIDAAEGTDGYNIPSEKLVSLQSILLNLKENIKDTVSQINIYRQDIFQCCIRGIKRKSFDPLNKLDVKFTDIEGTSEGAVDVGGPTREMFRIVLAYIKESNLFIGNEKKFLTLNAASLEKNEYYYAGLLIVLSLIHGGPGPHFFSESFYVALTEGIEKAVPCADFLEYDIKEKIMKIDKLSNIEDLQNYVTDEQIFAIAGVHLVRNIDDKEAIIQRKS